MSFYKNKGAVKSKAINLSEEESVGHGSWVVQIYRSTEYENGDGGNIGLRFKRGNFTVSGYLNSETLEDLPEAVRALEAMIPELVQRMAAFDGGRTGKVGTPSTRQVAPAAPAPAPEVKRGRGRPAGSKNRVTRVAETEVTPAPVTPVTPAPVAPAPVDLHRLVEQLAGDMATMKQALGILLAPRK